MSVSANPYEKRPIRFLELWRHGGWRIKIYGIASGRTRPRDKLIEAARVVAAERLANVAVSTGHYSVGFLGIHDGRTSNFVFVDWWADENELHHHVYTSPCDEPGRLTYVTPTGIMACVWDLRLIAFERDAWLDTVLKREGDATLENYLNQRLNEDV